MNGEAIRRLAVLSELQVSTRKLPQTGGGMRSTAQFDLRVPYVTDTIDVAAESARVQKKKEGLEKAIASKQTQLASETFRNKAPEKIIKQMEEELASQRVELQKLLERLNQLADR